ncbi:MAG: hypothetical protein P8Y18_02645 [Candidatus Bathyarchaeota archaeon]
MGESKINDAIITFVAIPLIIIIGLYLIACTVAPIAQLNNQTFKIIFTLAGGIPTLLFYSKGQIKRTL